ncbi:20618_t:CDS:1, partial [Dentiscutata erythropus]
ESSLSTQASEIKKCSDCHLEKQKTNICRPHSNNLLYEYKICNSYSIKHSKKYQKINQQNTTETNLNVMVPTIGTSTSRTNNISNLLQIHNIIENYDLESTENSFFFNEDFANIIEIEKQANNNADMLTYCMDEVEKFVSKQFRDTKSFSEPTKFAFEIKLNSGLLDNVALSQYSKNDSLNLERIKNSFA